MYKHQKMLRQLNSITYILKKKNDQDINLGIELKVFMPEVRCFTTPHKVHCFKNKSAIVYNIFVLAIGYFFVREGV